MGAQRGTITHDRRQTFWTPPAPDEQVADRHRSAGASSGLPSDAQPTRPRRRERSEKLLGEHSVHHCEHIEPSAGPSDEVVDAAMKMLRKVGHAAVREAAVITVSQR